MHILCPVVEEHVFVPVHGQRQEKCDLMVSSFEGSHVPCQNFYRQFFFFWEDMEVKGWISGVLGVADNRLFG